MQSVLPTHTEEQEPPRKQSFWRSQQGGRVFLLFMSVVGLALLTLLIKIPMWINDAKLTAMIGRFENYPLPPGTEWMDYDGPDASIALRGNGDHCDYRARFTLRTSLPIRELTDYYDRANIEGIEEAPPAITVWLPESSERSAYHSQGFAAGVVIVELYDSTGPGLDFRCR
ncbi:hypothetical protein GCM10010156_76900 [Planobispora rosea]|uniref:Uncharacterized protein n=1 Tax=Planobispora rosea TaxID=35762 RepID=A0A8J3WIU1_PLARO|nr:hypothetical protein [Planobispora rosea]GGT08522.1 hypothetical protein GCM10010156_76900 [Planobispora rosea]GIH89191.1 hypothetical protein Pro02_75990 [Planobispora rosea]